MRVSLEELLDAPGRLERQLWEARLDTQAIWESCFRLVSRYDGMGRSGGFADARDGQSAALADARAEEVRLQERLEQACGELEGLIDRVERIWGPREAMVLRWRYLLRQPWNRAQQEAERAFGRKVTLRTLHNWHRAAILHARELVEGETEAAS